MARGGSKPMLDEGKQREIVAILAVGCPRSVAARYVGCSPATIARTAARDPAFAARLRRAAYSTEVACLRQIRKAGEKEQYWRAAAWALERVFPERYARRGPDVLTFEQLAAAFAQLADVLCDEVPDAGARQRIVKRVDALLKQLKEQPPSKRRPPEGPSCEP
jgi:hypothetical protein